MSHRGTKPPDVGMVHFTQLSYGQRLGLVVFGFLTGACHLSDYLLVPGGRKLFPNLQQDMFCKQKANNRVALLTAGVTFGFQALKPILEEHGVYHELCLDKHDPKPCKEQTLRLNLMFAIASTCTNAFVLPIGIWLDYFGPKWTTAAGSVVFFAGNLLFAMSSSDFDAYIVGYALIAIGGPFMYMGVVHTTLAFPVKSGLIMAAITGAFDASSAIYELFREAHVWAGGVTGSLTLQHFFYAYCIVPVIIGIVNLLIQPVSSLQWSAEEVDFVEAATAVNPEDFPENEPLLGASDKEGNMSDRIGPRELEIQAMPFGRQLQTPEFWLLSISMLFYMCRVNFYISSAAEQLNDIGNRQPHHPPAPGIASQLLHLIQFFNIALPIAGIVSIPPVGWLIDTFPLWVSFVVLCVLAVTFGVLSLIPRLMLQYGSMVFMVLLRPLMYTAANEACSRTFGFFTFGKVYGLLMLIASIGNMITYALNYQALHVDHGSFLRVNVLLTIVFPLVLVLPAYMAWIRKRVAHNAVLVSEEGASRPPAHQNTLTDNIEQVSRRLNRKVKSPRSIIRRYSTNQGGQF